MDSDTPDLIAMVESASMTTLWQHTLELLVLQPTPFCNLDCRYCYLPDRNNLEIMSQVVLEQAVHQVFSADLPASKLSLVWHAGEPLVVPIDWYVDAFACVAGYNRQQVALEHHFQTNAVLINERWCEFIKQHDVKVGVSVDGPQQLHDLARRDRKGRGTFERVLAGVFRLQDAGIPFHVICVLTYESLDHADEICDFFAHLGVMQVGFNIEEIEADHVNSSLQREGTHEKFKVFFERVLQRIESGSVQFRVREVDAVLMALRSPLFGTLSGNCQNQAGRMLNVDYQGRYSTWSPEMLGAMHPRLGTMVLGSVFDRVFPADVGARGNALQNEIDAGVHACRQRCPYFDFCLGGAPANKLGEHGRFDVTETLYCRLTQQVVIDAVVAALDKGLPQRG